MARRFARAQSTQKYCLVPFSTEQVQVGGASAGDWAPQRAQTTGGASVPGAAGRGFGWSTSRRYPRGVRRAVRNAPGEPALADRSPRVVLPSRLKLS